MISNDLSSSWLISFFCLITSACRMPLVNFSAPEFACFFVVIFLCWYLILYIHHHFPDFIELSICDLLVHWASLSYFSFFVRQLIAHFFRVSFFSFILFLWLGRVSLFLYMWSFAEIWAFEKTTTSPSLSVLALCRGRSVTVSPAGGSRTSQVFYSLLLLLASDCRTAALMCCGAHLLFLVTFKLCSWFCQHFVRWDRNQCLGQPPDKPPELQMHSPLFRFHPEGRAPVWEVSSVCTALCQTGAGAWPWAGKHAECRELCSLLCWNLVLVLCWPECCSLSPGHWGSYRGVWSVYCCQLGISVRETWSFWSAVCWRHSPFLCHFFLLMNFLNKVQPIYIENCIHRNGTAWLLEVNTAIYIPDRETEYYQHSRTPFCPLPFTTLILSFQK